MKQTSLKDRLSTLLASKEAQTLARLAPIGLLSSTAGAIIGAVVMDPALAQTGLGLVLSGLAINASSSLLYDVIKPGADDDSRAAQIAAGLERRDPAVLRLVAEALTTAGPDLNQALPEPQRAALIAALSKGMTQSGAEVAAIAPQLTAALNAPPTSWTALQQQLHQTITTTTLLIEAGDQAQVIGNKQITPAGSGNNNLSIRASGSAVVKNNDQIIQSNAMDPDTRDPLLNDPEHLKELLNKKAEHLKAREVQVAQLGSAAPSEYHAEIAALTVEIRRLRSLLPSA